ncbi:MAG TPA: S4 domain-containing protein, partial [Candidatus Dormibacteraeota bacterium]|nr:S4 domain-containing protein [Candidatus Dormibacteraeota bacterium]
MTESPTHLVTAGAARLDRYLAGLLGDLSRTRVQQLIEDGHVHLNEGSARPGSRLRPGDRLT